MIVYKIKRKSDGLFCQSINSWTISWGEVGKIWANKKDLKIDLSAFVKKDLESYFVDNFDCDGIEIVEIEIIESKNYSLDSLVAQIKINQDVEYNELKYKGILGVKVLQ